MVLPATTQEHRRHKYDTVKSLSSLVSTPVCSHTVHLFSAFCRCAGGEEGESEKARQFGSVFPRVYLRHSAAQDVLALLMNHQVTDVDIDFRESFSMREVGPRILNHVHVHELLDPLSDVISPLTPIPGLPISTKVSLNTQRTVALYLAEGGDSDRPLGRRVLTSSLDPKKPSSTTFTTAIGLLEMSSCSARELSPTSSIRSNSGSDDTAWRFSA